MSESTRRGFIRGAAAVTLAAPAVGVHAAVGLQTDASAAGAVNESFRIRELDLLTAAPLEQMRRFYRDVLEFPILTSGDDLLSVQAGSSVLRFRPTKSGAPFYHFAFNIPENKITQARHWMAERTELAPTPKHMIDPGYPKDVRHFRSWNAHSIFFWDPAGNVLECIARHTLRNAAPGEFRARDMRYVSEIALIADDVGEYAELLKQQFQLPSYGQTSDQFHAVGDESGLLLVFRNGRHAREAKREPKEWTIFQTGVAVNPSISVKHKGLPYEVRT